MAAQRLAVLAGTSARADFQVTYNTTASLGNTFTYDVNFNTGIESDLVTPSQRLDAHTSGIPGPASLPNNTIGDNTGSLGTVYDFAGATAADVVLNDTVNFRLSTSNVGVTGADVNPGDDPTLLNVTVYYIGASRTTDVFFGSVFTVTTAAGFTGLDTNGSYFGRTTKAAGASTGTAVDAIGHTTVSVRAVPEPASMALLVMGLAGLGVRIRMKSRVAV